MARSTPATGAVATLLLTLTGPLAAAADAPPAPDAAGPVFETVVVGESAGEDRFRSERSVSVVPARALAEGAPRTAPEALWDAPGVWVQETNYGAGSPIIRGLVGPQVLILVDGVRLNNSVYRTGPVQYLNLVDPLHLDRIEILRGPGSVLYGSDAMGGVIEVRPAWPEERPEPRYGAARVVGRYSSADAGAVVGGRLAGGIRRTSALAGFSFKHFGDLRGGGDAGEQIYSGYRSGSATATAVHRLQAGRVPVTLSATYLGSFLLDAGRTDALFDKHSLRTSDNLDHLAYARATALLPWARTLTSVTLSYQDFFERKDTIQVADDLRTPLARIRDETVARTLGTDLGATSRFLAGRLIVRVGGMWYRDFVSADRLAQDGAAPLARVPEQDYPDGSTYDNYGGFALAEADVLVRGAHRIRTGAGYRLHGMAGHAPPLGPLPAVALAGLGHVVHGSLQYLLDRHLTLALTFSQGFRAPNLQEAVMLGDTGRFFSIPNGALRPESSDTLELVGRARLGRVTASWAGYATFIDDLIKRVDATWEGRAVMGGKDVVQNVNGNAGVVLGTEADLQVAMGRGFSASAHVAYTWGEERPPAAPAIPLTRIPPLFGGAKLRYDAPRWGRWRGYAEAYVRAARTQSRLSPHDETDTRIPPGGTPGWWTLNCAAGAAMGERLRIALRVENLLDDKYKYHGSGVYAPGANAVVALEGSL